MCLSAVSAAGDKFSYPSGYESGTPLGAPTRSQRGKLLEDAVSAVSERFWAKVKRGEPGQCWEWLGTSTGNGYGKFWFGDGKEGLAHRWSYVESKGSIPEGLQIDHLCRNRACVNPSHLEAVTPAENTRRGESCEKRRSATVCKNGHPFDAENTISRIDNRTGGKKRECRVCQRQHNARYKERLRSRAALEPRND